MTATQKYQALVEAVAKEKGCDRSTAAAIVAKEYPAVRRAMLEEANPGRDVGAVMGSRRD